MIESLLRKRRSPATVGFENDFSSHFFIVAPASSGQSSKPAKAYSGLTEVGIRGGEINMRPEKTQ
jgi:hypothetical protein